MNMLKRLFAVAVVIAALAPNICASNSLTLEDCALNARPQVPNEMVSEQSGTTYLMLSDDGQRVERFDYKTGKKLETVMDSNDVNGSAADCWDGFVLSPNEKLMLLYTDTETIYRHSFKATYYIYDIARKNIKKLSEHGKVEIPSFSPDGRMVAFVRDNNVYVAKIDYGTEVAVTKDGAKNSVINGVPDWVYQEEFGMLSSLTWSPDNLMLAFIRWDESEVPLYSLPLYEGGCNPMPQYSKYPGSFEYKYPVAGEKNSKVSVLSYDVETRALKTMKLPIDSESYINKIEFGLSADKLMVNTLNRNQNEMRLYYVNPRSAIAKLLYTDKSTSWINPDLTSMTKYYSDFFVVASEKSGFCHLYQYSNGGVLMKQLTKGEWNVTDFYGYNPANRTFYFQSNQGSPLETVVSSVDSKGVIKNLSIVKGANSATFNSTLSYYILNHSDVNTPNIYDLYTAAGKKVRTILDNKAYADMYAGKLPQKEFVTFDANGYTFNGYIIKPNDFEASKKYPVIMYQYSGPDSQLVLNRWEVDWLHYAAQSGYIVACFDGRGTGGRGKAFSSAVYKQLGKYESIDQIAAAKYMASQAYVDSSRIGIFGWSYGGYETIMAMSQSDSPYAAGVAVAPVTDWRLYDSIYAERFMLTPQQNSTGYDASSAIKRADKLNGRLLIITGTADDNVHPANTYEYVSKATTEGKILDMMVYPNENHFIRGCGVRLTLYTKILDFFDSRLK